MDAREFRSVRFARRFAQSLLTFAVATLASFEPASAAHATVQAPQGNDALRRIAPGLGPQSVELSRMAVERRADRSLVLDAKDAPQKLDVTRFEALDSSGRTLALTQTADGRFSVADAADQWVFVRPKVPTELRVVKGRQWLPGFGLSPASGGREPAVVASYVEFATAPIAWDVERDSYRLLAQIGVAQADDPTRTGALDPRAEIRVAYEGIAGAEPQALAITELGIAGERSIELVFRTVSSATPRLVLRSSLSGEQPFALDVASRIALDVAADAVLGFGLERVRVTAQAVAPNGALVALASPTDLLVRGERLLIEDADALQLPAAGGTVAFAARSKWLGVGRVVASARTASGELHGSASVEQRAPWLQLCAALAGGALGGFARRFVKGARKERNPRHVLEGLIVGAVAFVAGVLGVGYLDLPSALVATLAGAFLTGTLTGFVGVLVLERLVERKA
ncbi:MAG: hypothetical protein L6Q99_04480 [Planctomycetes bacterium]|nr:hypothetical protein [Planctomycetota bacterium]